MNCSPDSNYYQGFFMNDLKEISVRKTKDGSTTLHVQGMNETYHSSHGAMQEAVHVFVENGLKLLSKPSIKVLEVGFGTGLNALLASSFALSEKQVIDYIGLETLPLNFEMISKLNYLDFDYNLKHSGFDEIHSCEWEKRVEINDYFTLKKLQISVQEYKPEESFDIIFYDAFGPRAQGEMWEKAIFDTLYNSLNPNGLLVTYCAMGQFKRDLKAVGFSVKNVPGPPGKREMTIAIKE